MSIETEWFELSVSGPGKSLIALFFELAGKVDSGVVIGMWGDEETGEAATNSLSKRIFELFGRGFVEWGFWFESFLG